MNLFWLIIKNLRRNVVRTVLTGLGTIILVLVVTMIWTVLNFLDEATAEKSQDLKAIVTDRWRLPSQMPFAYASELERGAARDANDVKPTDSMTWQFFGGTLDPTKKGFRDAVFGFAMEPKKLLTMMDGLENLPENDPATKAFKDAVAKLETNIQGIIVGASRLADLNKQVGDRFTLYGLNYRDIQMEFEIVGVFPPGRYDQSTAFNREYLNRALDDYKAKNKQPHPLAERTLNLVWLRVPQKDLFEQLVDQITTSPSFTTPAVKCETASAGVTSFLEGYKDLLLGIKWLLAPAIIGTLTLVLANSISIGVRERRKEMAVMKVLGYRPYHILILVLGEALLLGTGAGFIASAAAYWGINGAGGIPFPIAFFPVFLVPWQALWWGPAVGGGTALLGSIIPALSARGTRVAEVFSKIS